MKSLILTLGVLGIASAIGCTQPVGAPGEDGKTTAPLAEGDKKLTKMAPVAIDAKFDRWLLSPTGDVRAMMLDDSTVVHVGHDVDTNTIKKGDALHVEGKSFGDNKMLGMAEVKKDGAVVIAAPKWGEHGPMAHHKGDFKKGDFKKGKHDKAGWEAKKAEHEKKMAALAPMTTEAKVDGILPGRHGRAHGYVLSDGTVAYLPHHANLEGVTINKGDTIKVEGRGGSYALGKALEIQSVTVNGTTKTL
jgi:hypothetical protein